MPPFEIAIMPVEGGEAHPERLGELGHREAVGAELGEGAAADGFDEGLTFRVPPIEERAGFGHLLGEGADGSGWVFHGREDSERKRNGQVQSLRGCGWGRLASWGCRAGGLRPARGRGGGRVARWDILGMRSGLL